ncbi:STAS domain-containing protein [Maribrevibacterium harenarium]|uniref:STAS domain-containing protein n=1 Tax=Maribrevibacterium harenarium TaxID=2589817 RepID=A0A501WSD6_9GAMM|nr:STAS domain-containing protein [Maribrevibacterium harenarium]TPE52349.1 STAS domain-containing protein [Maribrevibacterium harenarium]
MLTFACDASCCRLTGSFTAESFRAVKQDVRVKVSPNSPCSLDVSGLAVVNSPILSLLLEVARISGHPVSLVGVTDSIQRMVALYGLHPVLKISD